ncbi:MAG: hypothetical protein RIR52_2602 [Acidobacteriota bacterium]
MIVKREGTPHLTTENRHLFRWLGSLPILFFAIRVIEYVWIAGTPEQILWCCHVSNLLLGIGMIRRHPRTIRVASLWLLVGLPPWLFDMVISGLVTPVSVLSHLGGALVALLALHRFRPTGRDWLPALLFFVTLQQVTRLLTVPSPLTNVNVAHFAYGPFRDTVPYYWLYIVVNSLLAGIILLVVERLVCLLFPPSTVAPIGTMKKAGEEATH